MSTELVHRVSALEMNAIANSPTVLPYLNPYADCIDMVSGSADWIILGYGTVEGCVCFRPNGLGGLYEAHYMFNSKRAPIAARACVDWLFTYTNAQAIYGFTPRSNRAARTLNVWLGGSPVSEQKDAGGRDCLVYELTREKWVSAPGLQARKTMRLTS